MFSIIYLFLLMFVISFVLFSAVKYNVFYNISSCNAHFLFSFAHSLYNKNEGMLRLLRLVRVSPEATLRRYVCNCGGRIDDISYVDNEKEGEKRKRSNNDCVRDYTRFMAGSTLLVALYCCWCFYLRGWMDISTWSWFSHKNFEWFLFCLFSLWWLVRYRGII